MKLTFTDKGIEYVIEVENHNMMEFLKQYAVPAKKETLTEYLEKNEGGITEAKLANALIRIVGGCNIRDYCFLSEQLHIVLDQLSRWNTVPKECKEIALEELKK